ncbi:MAG TPA: hypothetical protein DCE80_09595, partial [Ignavibacteriales bacterium]|nr:hypothetical protein [Ignavibacteriales bacterium]
TNFLTEFNQDKSKYSNSTLLFGVMKDKAIKEMLTLLRDSFEKILITDIDYERACKISELEKIAAEINLNVNSVTNPGKYVAAFKEENPSKCLVVLGSMYLLGAIKTDLERIKIS